MNKATITTINSVIDKYVAGDINGRGFQVDSTKTPLCELAFKYRSDKCEEIKHPFTKFYFDLLSGQQRSIRKILEIGVGMKRQGSHSDNTMGPGLHMWKEFFPLAQVYGADSDPRVMFRDGRIKTFLCDQSKKDDLANLVRSTGTNLDLVIDDGSHVPQDQIGTCLTLMPLLKKEVVYIIEDVHDQNIINSFWGYDAKLISLRGSNGKRYADDKLIIVRNASAWS